MKIWIKSVCFVFVVAVVMSFANQAKATLLPWLDFGTQFTWDGSSLYTDQTSTTEYVTTVTYNDLSSDGYPFPSDPVIGSEVTMSLSFDGTSNDWLNVAGWFSADIIITNPSFNPIGSPLPSPYTAMLNNIVYLGSVGSQWWDEFSATLNPANTYDAELILGFTGSRDTGGGTYLVNGSGKVAPIPEPGTIALLGIGLAGLVGVGVRRKMKKKVD